MVGGLLVFGLEDSLAVIEGCAVTYVVELCVLPNGFAPWGLGPKTCPGMRHARLARQGSRKETFQMVQEMPRAPAQRMDGSTKLHVRVGLHRIVQCMQKAPVVSRVCVPSHTRLQGASTDRTRWRCCNDESLEFKETTALPVAHKDTWN